MASMQAEGSPHSFSGKSRTAKVLIVENNIIVAHYTDVLLKKLGHETVGVCGSGQEALKLAALKHPDLILMDIALDGPMDGIEAANRILEKQAVPIVYCTAYSDLETLLRAQQTLPFGYLVKPFELNDLKASIEISLYKFDAEQKLAQKDRELVASNLAMEKLNTELRVLLKRLDEAQEQERRRLSSEIHDALGQELIALKMSTAYIEKNLLPGQEKLREILSQNDRALAGLTETVHFLSHSLRPAMLDDVGLIPTLEYDFNRIETVYQCTVRRHWNMCPSSWTSDVRFGVYRVIQEALTNILKHARASTIDVTIDTDATGNWRVMVEDNGEGFSELSAAGRHGRLSMRERMLALGGTCTVQSEPGRGTRVTLTWPG
jgi:signal transduction histidine kinase